MLIPNNLGNNPKQLLINYAVTHFLSMQNSSKICTALNKQVFIIHLDKKFPTFLYVHAILTKSPLCIILAEINQFYTFHIFPLDYDNVLQYSMWVQTLQQNMRPPLSGFNPSTH
jgi:hypothetical protein